MKRVKLMVLSLCVLAAVGGALAFKAKGALDFCYASPNSTGPDFCKDAGVLKKCLDRTTIGKVVTSNIFFCTTPTSGNSAAPCTNLDCGATSVKVTTIEP